MRFGECARLSGTPVPRRKTMLLKVHECVLAVKQFENLKGARSRSAVGAPVYASCLPFVSSIDNRFSRRARRSGTGRSSTRIRISSGRWTIPDFLCSVLPPLACFQCSSDRVTIVECSRSTVDLDVDRSAVRVFAARARVVSHT